MRKIKDAVFYVVMLILLCIIAEFVKDGLVYNGVPIEDGFWTSFVCGAISAIIAEELYFLRKKAHRCGYYL